MQTKLPAWLLKQEGLTPRQWKARKRKELKDLIKAFGVYRIGCVYTPGCGTEVDDISKILKELETMLSVKEWGR